MPHATQMSAADTGASHCVAANANEVQVEVQLTYSPVFTGLFYGGDVTVRGEAVAENEVGCRSHLRGEPWAGAIAAAHGPR